MKKRLIDIYPPNSLESIGGSAEENAAELIPHTGHKQRRGFGLGTGLVFALFLSIFLLGAVHLFFVRAAIQVWPSMTELHITEHITAQVGYDGVNFEKKLIGARIFEAEVEKSLLVPSSQTAFKEEPARGVIRVYNEQTGSSQALVANTRFISEDGKLFRSEEAATIPAATSAGHGYRDVSVVAAESGESYNIGPSTFSLPGLVGSPLYTKVYGESSGAMTGGASREVPIVADEDIAAAQQELKSTLETEGANALLAKVPAQFQILPDSLKTSFIEDSSLAKEGAELEQFTYRGKMKISAIGFQKEDADLLVRRLLGDQLQENQAIYEDTLRVAYTEQSNTGGGDTLPLTVDISVQRYQQIDENALKNRLRNADTQNLGSLLREYPHFAKTEISLWPFWVSQVPSDIGKIKLNLRLDGTPS